MEYKVSELAQKAGVTKRTIHYYISKGLLMPPNGSGVSSVYNDSHLERLLLIKSLQAQYMPLNKIREYLLNNNQENNAGEFKETSEFLNKSNEQVNLMSDFDVYIKENVCNIFEIHCSLENSEKYKYIIQNVKAYVEKMLED